jgi:CRP/FNR family cyclic AMP-dependent transcriptional regulator
MTTIRTRVNTDPPSSRTPRRPRPLRRDAESFTRETLLERQPWWPGVSAQARDLVLREASERVLAIGEHLGRNGEPQSHWYGVLEGLLKWTISVPDGRTATLGGQLAGSWFGEASLIRGRPRRADIIALRHSRVLLIPRDLFDWLRHSQPAFADFMQRLLAERILWLMSNSAAHRLMDVDHMVARALVGLMHPVLNMHPVADETRVPLINISQEELAQLVTTSRQRCNKALARLQALGLVDMAYGGIAVTDLAGLHEMTADCTL